MQQTQNKNKKSVAIIGTGDFAHGIAHLIMNYNSESLGNVLAVTKPGIEKGSGTFHRTGVPLVNFEEAMWRADAAILAIPAAVVSKKTSPKVKIQPPSIKTLPASERKLLEGQPDGTVMDLRLPTESNTMANMNQDTILQSKTRCND